MTFITQSNAPLLPNAAVDRTAYCLALGASNPGLALLEVMRKDMGLSTLLAASAGVYEKYSVETHHEMVLGQQQRYRLGKSCPNPLSPQSPHIGERGIITVLGHHDLNKFINEEFKDKQLEHQRTCTVLESYRHLFPFSDPQFQVIKDLICNNSLGDLFRNSTHRLPDAEDKKKVMNLHRESLLTPGLYHDTVDRWYFFVISSAKSDLEMGEMISSCAKSFRHRAQNLGLKPLELLDYQIAVFQSDVSSYTADACHRNGSGVPSLDYLFVRNKIPDSAGLFTAVENEARLLFSPFFEMIYQNLRSELRRC